MDSRLYVGNFSFNTSGGELCKAFARCSEATDVHLVGDRQTAGPAGVCVQQSWTFDRGSAPARCADEPPSKVRTTGPRLP